MFAPEALKYMNETYDMRYIGRDEARRILEKEQPMGWEDMLAEVMEKKKHLVLIDGEYMLEGQAYEMYIQCEKCSKFALRDPLTWGVQAWHEWQGGSYCNNCYPLIVIEAVEKHTHEHWPVYDELPFEIFRHALEHRATEDRLEKGWTVIAQSGTAQDGKTAKQVHQEFAEVVKKTPAEYVVTVIAWQFCEDLFLWQRVRT